MARKYFRFDLAVYDWLDNNPKEATTAKAIAALRITDETEQRRVGRLFTQLQDQGAIVCRKDGATRVCTVISMPNVPVGGKGKPFVIGPGPARQAALKGSQPAYSTDEFLAAGGTIERLPAHWDRPDPHANPIGPTTLIDQVIASE